MVKVMKAIVSVDKIWGIGKNNKLLFHNKEDMKFFKKMTTGKVVLMGRKTLQSLPNGKLPDRMNIVLSTTKNKCDEDDLFIGDFSEVEEKLKNYNTDDVFVIGGMQIYKKYLDRCDTVYVTHVNNIYEDADAYIYNIALQNFIPKKVVYSCDDFSIIEWVRNDNPYGTCFIWAYNKKENDVLFIKSNKTYKRWIGVSNDLKTVDANDMTMLKEMLENSFFGRIDTSIRINGTRQCIEKMGNEFPIYRLAMGAQSKDGNYELHWITYGESRYASQKVYFNSRKAIRKLLDVKNVI